LCPACNARRMEQVAAHLTDEVKLLERLARLDQSPAF